MTLDDCGLPTDGEPEKKRHFEFVIPEDARVKGFKELSGDTPDPWIWEDRCRENFRAR
jgi:hypothetical protein